MNADPAPVSIALSILAPELLLAVSAVVMMTAGAFLNLSRQVWAGFSATVLIAALLVLGSLQGLGASADPLELIVLNDGFGHAMRILFLITGLILLGLGVDQVADERAAEFFGSLLLIVSGAMIVSAANELVLLFVGLELVSIPTYLMLYLPRRTTLTQEVVIKYFFISVFSSALLLFGMAYLYGVAGVSNLQGVAAALRASEGAVSDTTARFCLIALGFMMAGFGFRVAAVPFHFYAPDVYQGAATIVTAMLAWVPKGIGFIAIIRALTTVVSAAPDSVAAPAALLAWILAIATMVLGNTVALVQRDIKRLLAYSSIAHAGYLMIGVAAAFAAVPDLDPSSGSTGPGSIFVYLVVYAFMTLGAFGVILLLNRGERGYETIDDFSGLARSRPLVALAMGVSLFSLAGIPPLAGFWGKFAIFSAAWITEPRPGCPSLRFLAVLGAVNAAIGAFYYLRIVTLMYFGNASSDAESEREPIAWPLAASLTGCVALTIALGILPAPILRAARSASEAGVARAVVRADLHEQAPRLDQTETLARETGKKRGPSYSTPLWE